MRAFAGIACAIYTEGYRQQYSDLHTALDSISILEDYNDESLCTNLAQLAEFIRERPDEYSNECFMGAIKLADHINLDVQRSRQNDDTSRKIDRLRREIGTVERNVYNVEKKATAASEKVQHSQIEIVGILSIFAAIVVAFSGGLNYLGGTISTSGDSGIGNVAFSVILCGLMLFNIIAFLLYMVLAIIRGAPARASKGLESRISAIPGAWFVICFDIVLVLLLFAMVVSGVINT